MIAPITIYEGAGSLEQILDFSTRPLLAAKWADSIVRRFTVTAIPMDILLPGAAGPRLAQMGLAVFHLSHMMDKAIPRMLEPCQPIVEVAGARSAAVDVPTEFLPKMVAALHAPLFRGALIRQPQHRARLAVNASHCEWSSLLVRLRWTQFLCYSHFVRYLLGRWYIMAYTRPLARLTRSFWNLAMGSISVITARCAGKRYCSRLRGRWYNRWRRRRRGAVR